MRNIYEKLGFVDAGHATLAEAFEANGESGLLPADGGASQPEKYFTRAPLVMTKVISM